MGDKCVPCVGNEASPGGVNATCKPCGPDQKPSADKGECVNLRACGRAQSACCARLRTTACQRRRRGAALPRPFSPCLEVLHWNICFLSALYQSGCQSVFKAPHPPSRRRPFCSQLSARRGHRYRGRGLPAVRRDFFLPRRRERDVHPVPRWPEGLCEQDQMHHRRCARGSFGVAACGAGLACWLALRGAVGHLCRACQNQQTEATCHGSSACCLPALRCRAPTSVRDPSAELTFTHPTYEPRSLECSCSP